MPSVTLAESAKLSQDMLVSGVIENVITVNQFFQVLPFQPIEGNALAYNRENALGDVQFAGVGSTITAKAPATFTMVTSSLTTIVGDADERSDPSTRLRCRSEALRSLKRSRSRQYQNTMINGDGTPIAQRLCRWSCLSIRDRRFV